MVLVTSRNKKSRGTLTLTDKGLIFTGRMKSHVFSNKETVTFSIALSDIVSINKESGAGPDGPAHILITLANAASYRFTNEDAKLPDTKYSVDEWIEFVQEALLNECFTREGYDINLSLIDSRIDAIINNLSSVNLIPPTHNLP